jgi:osmotically-inducible protein OsmY
VIADELEVHPLVGRHRTDDPIRTAALERLNSDSRIHSEHIHVTVSHGHVTLKGHVRYESERSAAAEGIQGLDGVVELSNRIEIS